VRTGTNGVDCLSTALGGFSSPLPFFDRAARLNDEPSGPADPRQHLRALVKIEVGSVPACAARPLYPPRADVARPRPKFILLLISQAIPIPLSSQKCLGQLQSLLAREGDVVPVEIFGWPDPAHGKESTSDSRCQPGGRFRPGTAAILRSPAASLPPDRISSYQSTV
jgi:hypothetical protein